MEAHEVEEEQPLPPPSVLTVAVAVNGKTNCKFAVNWALEKFVPEGKVMFKLLHVRPKIKMVPTAMGNHIPVSKVRDEVAAAYKREIEWHTTAMLLPYKHMCSQKKVQAETMVIEADDVANAISEKIAKLSIDKLVIGASSRSLLVRKLRGCDVAAKISKCIPRFCTVYVISKGRLSSVRAPTSGSNGITRDERRDSNLSTNSCLSSTSSTQTGSTGTTSTVNISHSRSSSLPDQFFQTYLKQAIINKEAKPTDIHHFTSPSLRTEEDTRSSISTCSVIHYDGSITSSHRSSQTENQSWISDKAATADIQTDSSLPASQVNINYELERLRFELSQIQGMNAMAQNDKIDAFQQLNDLSKRHMEETMKLEAISLREEEARKEEKLEKERTKALRRQAEVLRDCTEREARQRKGAEMQAAHDAEEKQKLEKALMHSDQQYKEFTWEEIVSATSSFSDALRIGMGGYGTVYRCSLHHTTTAVKVLHSNEGHRTKQFLQELEILSRIRHPHLLLLIGACPDHGCLVYEYMDNGSLDDRLFQKNNTPPIPWFDRYRIAWEIASALVFLHNSKPKPVVHRDLKPANILLDHNLVSKIGDIGLSTLLPTADSSMSTMYKDTAPTGTFCYIDPEYQRNGLVSPQSDVYAFGIVILQLLTARPALAVTDTVETALEEGHLADVLDHEAGEWPHKETEELAILGLRCAELRRRDRPNLKDQVLPVLERLKGMADRARNSTPDDLSIPPRHFICPIFLDVMEDPCVAADGYTYEHQAIKLWLSMSDKSPLTNSPLPHKYLTPNCALLSAIKEWKTKNQLHLCDHS